MRGLVFDIKRFAVHDGPGIRTTIFLKGCPLNCLWCHNPESKSSVSLDISRAFSLDGSIFTRQIPVGKNYTIEELLEIVLKDEVFFIESKGGVTLSGGEPLQQFNFAKDFLEACKMRGLHTTIDTSGYASTEIIEQVAMFTDLFLYDIKIMDSQMHKHYTGIDNQLILDNLKMLSSSGKTIIIRVPLISGINDNTSNIELLTNFVRNHTSVKEVHLLPYHHLAAQKHCRFSGNQQHHNLKPPDESVLSHIKSHLISWGFKVKIGG